MQDRPRKQDIPTFERALRAWGRRPPRLSAGSAAARIDERLDRRQLRLHPWRLVAAAATIVAIVGGVWLLSVDGPRSPERVGPAAPSPGPTVPPLGDDVVLWWLDSETPVYFVIDSPDSGGGPTP
jgi:hypothetical protein